MQTYQGDRHGCMQYPDGKTSGPPQRPLGHKAAKNMVVKPLASSQAGLCQRTF